ncbi:MAG TPA: TolC family protein [Bryobacteraceae bacterium]|jgi:outer membrane protein TolC|nr:TolC family protein [Bryobacteraceae bacterium]
MKIRNGTAARLAVLALAAWEMSGASFAQTRLTLDDAIQQGLQARASLKAGSESIAVAKGLERQVRLRPNPEFLFQNENLRPGQTYSRDVDTVAYLTQPLELFGKRARRIALARETVSRTQAEYDLARMRVTGAIKLAYWAARGAQADSEVLQASAANFQQTVDYHAARFSAGAIAEQDLLRVRLEHERLKISAGLASIEAHRALMALFKEMGRPANGVIVLTEPLDAPSGFEEKPFEAVLAERADAKLARADLVESEAKLRVEENAARPDVSVFGGYKRTQLPDTTSGVNTLIAGFQIGLPVSNRNQGNREAAEAEVRRRRQLLAEVEADVRAEYDAAIDEYRMRRDEAVTALEPLGQQAREIERIANAAYAEGGAELLRLLDAERARIDADLAWTRGMAEYHQSIVRLEIAEGVEP